MNLQNTKVENQEVVISDGTIFNAIGPNVTLENCVIKCSVPAKSISLQGRFYNCKFIVEKPLNNFSWLDAKFEHCSFHGLLKSNEFGSLPKHSGYTRACDFSEAFLQDCVFYGNDCASNFYPKWPIFTVEKCEQHIVLLHDSNDDILIEIADSLDDYDDSLGAICFNAETFSKELGVTSENIKNSLKLVDFIKF